MRHLAVIISALFVLQTAAFAATYTIDKDHSTASFSVRHLVSKVNGTFNDFGGKIDFDEKHPNKGSVEATFKVASIDTHVTKRDEHLKSPDFFDAGKFPEMKFKSTKISGSGKKFKVEGILSLHGVDKPVTLTTEFGGTTKDPWGNTRAGFSASTKINRKDFGLNWNKTLETGGLMVGDDIAVNLEIEAIQDKDDAKDTKGAMKETSKEETKKQ